MEKLAIQSHEAVINRRPGSLTASRNRHSLGEQVGLKELTVPLTGVVG